MRDATAATHLRMHGLPAFRAIEEGRLGFPDYARLLAALARFHGAVGAALEAGPCARFSSAGRRLAALRRDLAHIGAPPPGAPAEWTLPSGGGALGALYVAEGSMVGGRVIARRLDYLFGTAAEGRTFFAGTAEDRPAWRRVLALLGEQRVDEAGRAEMARGAEACFALFEESMEARA
ncbi:MAG TPA: biliverdin-producing heme oxygenase [Allosphingosinicella sp.]|nr:biliverdin-producing heme oxygenase [Allosphingosinicella sp.]